MLKKCILSALFEGRRGVCGSLSRTGPIHESWTISEGGRVCVPCYPSDHHSNIVLSGAPYWAPIIPPRQPLGQAVYVFAVWVSGTI